MTARRVAQTAAIVVIAAAVGLAFVVYFGGNNGRPDQLRYAVSFALPYAMTGVVSLIAIARGTPRFAVAAGWVLIPISFLSFVLVPLVIPALVLIGAGVRLLIPGGRLSVEIPASLVIVGGTVASLVAVLVFREPIEWHTSTSWHASEQTTWVGSLISWAILVVVLFAATIRDGRRTAPVGPAPQDRSPSGHLA